MQDVRKNLEATYVDIIVTNWKIWPATQLANFYFVPFKHRILVILKLPLPMTNEPLLQHQSFQVVNIVALFWNTYLAYKTNASPLE